jgi:hypothetical protein
MYVWNPAATTGPINTNTGPINTDSNPVNTTKGELTAPPEVDR